MLKKTLFIFVVLLLSACSSRQYSQSSLIDSKIDIYQQTHNYVALVDLYKTQLKEDDTSDLREDLAENLLKLEDPENALFYLKPNIKEEPSGRTLFLQASALGDLGQYQEAISTALKALNEDPENAKTENLLGILYGHEYQYEKARRYFNKAKLHFYDSNTIANNLAVLDIAEGKYKQAARRLLPIYRTGQADEQIIANLVLSMAKEGNREFVDSVLSGSYNKQEVEHIYQSLQKVDGFSYEQVTQEQ